MGDFKRGFHYVDLKSDGAWRLGKNFALNQEALSHIVLWDGEPLDGKNILIYCEQGFGDNIQFVRYIPQVRELGGRVIFSCYDQLHSVFKDSPILKDVDVVKGASINSVYLHFKIPLISIPRVLEATIYLSQMGICRESAVRIGDYPLTVLMLHWCGSQVDLILVVPYPLKR